jgi:hypothetical protein
LQWILYGLTESSPRGQGVASTAKKTAPPSEGCGGERDSGMCGDVLADNVVFLWAVFYFGIHGIRREVQQSRLGYACNPTLISFTRLMMLGCQKPGNPIYGALFCVA